MKNLNMGAQWKIRFLGGFHWKANIVWGIASEVGEGRELGLFADLRAAWQKRGGDTPMHTLLFVFGRDRFIVYICFKETFFFNFSYKQFNKYFSLPQSTCQFRVL